jgi:hypothetical protein
MNVQVQRSRSRVECNETRAMVTVRSQRRKSDKEERQGRAMSDEHATCATCGAELDEVAGIPAEERRPCPTCGGLGRVIHLAAVAPLRRSAD